jgi:hypothetical protein
MGASNNNTVITAPATAAFQRVLLNQTPSVNATLTKTGDDTTTYSATVNPANTGLTITADGSISNADPASEIITFNLQNNANGSGSTGVKSYTAIIDNLAANGGTGQGSNDPNDSIAVSATVVANRNLTGGTAALGRVMINTNTASVNTTIDGGSVDDNNATRVNVNNGSVASGGVTVTRIGGTQLIDTANETATVGVVGNFATTGSKSGSVNVASLLSNGETTITGTPTVDTSVLIGYTAAAVDNRTLSATGVSLGRVLVNQTTNSQNSTVSSATNTDTSLTRVTLGAGPFTSSVTDGTITLGSGSAYQYGATNDATNSTARGVTGSFTTTGSKSGNATFTPTAEGLTGESVQSFTLGYTATALAPRTITGPAPTLIGAFLKNGSGLVAGSAGFTSTAANNVATSVSVAGTSGPDANNLSLTGSATSLDGATTSGSRSFSGTFSNTGSYGTVNGTLYVAVNTLENGGAGLTGEGAYSMVPFAYNINVGQAATDMSGTGSFNGTVLSASLAAGTHTDLSSVSVGSTPTGGGPALNSEATILTTTVASLTTVSMTWRNRTSSETTFNEGGTPTSPPLPYAGHNGLVSDVVQLTGLDGVTFVLQMTYDETQLPGGASSETALYGTESLYLGWLDPNGGGSGIPKWRNAIDGNHGPNVGLTNLFGSWSANGSSTVLGTWGVDTTANTVWAVLDHNSIFAAVPEPNTLALLLAGSSALLFARRARRR